MRTRLPLPPDHRLHLAAVGLTAALLLAADGLDAAEPAAAAPAAAEIAPAQVVSAAVAADAPATARAFADAVVARQGAAARALGAAQLAASLTDPTIAQIMDAVEAQVGIIAGTEAAWQEDVADGYARYRVAVRGAKGSLDFQVVVDGAGKVAGLWLKPHVEAPAGGAAVPPLPPAPLPTPADPAPREVEVSVGAGADALPGTLSLPAGEGPFPVVVLVHGSGPSDRDETVLGNKPFRDLAWGLAARGVATLRYDKRTYAAPQTLREIGVKLTVQHETIDDAVAAVALARARAEIDPKRVYVLGHSLGGMVAPRIAQQAAADGLVIMAGGTRPLPELVVEQVTHIASVDGKVTAEEAEQIATLKGEVAAFRAARPGEAAGATFMGAPAGYYADLEAHDAPAEAAALGIPVFVLQGLRDYQVTMTDLRAWETALRGRPQACFKAYGDLDHLMRPGQGPSSPADYAEPRLVAPMVIADIAKFVLQGCATPRR